ncbi:MAG: FlgD immunoglobulin-like domain containing protein [Chitinophagaceae bacterium]
MKRFTTLLLVITTLVIAKPGHSYAQETGKTYCPTNFMRICFTDDFGDKYVFNNIDLTDCNIITATGEVRNITSYPWNATMIANFSGGGSTGNFTMHAINPQMDGCANGYVDSVTVVGTITISNSGGVRTYSGEGDWSNYCNGSVDGTGTLSVSGPCGVGLLPQFKTAGKQPGKVTTDMFQLKIVPNPVKNYTNISYNLPKSSTVNITIYNIMNQPVKVLVSENQSNGAHTANWNGQTNSGSRAANGIYKVVATINGKIYSENIQVLQ